MLLLQGENAVAGTDKFFLSSYLPQWETAVLYCTVVNSLLGVIIGYVHNTRTRIIVLRLNNTATGTCITKVNSTCINRAFFRVAVLVDQSSNVLS